MNSLSFKIRFLSFFFLGVFCHCSFAQEVVWLDENHNQTSEAEAVYYRPLSEQNKGGNYLIEDYYKSGDLYRTGKAASMTVRKEMFRGFVTYFYKDQSTFKEEKYKNGVLDGPYKEFYPSGELKVDGVYDKGLRERMWKIYYKTGKIKTKGKYRSGEKVGEWTTFYRDVYYPIDE